MLNHSQKRPSSVAKPKWKKEKSMKHNYHHHKCKYFHYQDIKIKIHYQQMVTQK